MLELLLVDPLPPAVETVASALRSGYRITMARSGDGALQIVRGLRYDVVVTELDLPDMDGLELVKSIRSRDNMIPIVVWSRVQDLDRVVSVMREGADDYVQKKREDLGDNLVPVLERAIKRKKTEKRLQVFEGILPICAYCKKIRHLRDKEYVWVTIEQYFEEKKAGIEFSHGICSQCLKDHGENEEDPVSRIVYEK